MLQPSQQCWQQGEIRPRQREHYGRRRREDNDALGVLCYNLKHIISIKVLSVPTKAPLWYCGLLFYPKPLLCLFVPNLILWETTYILELSLWPTCTQIHIEIAGTTKGTWVGIGPMATECLLLKAHKKFSWFFTIRPTWSISTWDRWVVLLPVHAILKHLWRVRKWPGLVPIISARGFWERSVEVVVTVPTTNCSLATSLSCNFDQYFRSPKTLVLDAWLYS